MSIYGPRPRPPPRPGVRAAGMTLATIVVLSLLAGVGVYAALRFERATQVDLEIDRAESIRRDIERSMERVRLQSAEIILPPVPEPPDIALPEPLRLQSADIVPPPRPREIPPPESLQSAEIIFTR